MDNTIGNGNFVGDLFAEKQGRHYWNIGNRQYQGSQNGKSDGLGHRLKGFSLDALQREDRYKNNQDNQYAKSGSPVYSGGGFCYYLIHFLSGQLSPYVIHG